MSTALLVQELDGLIPQKELLELTDWDRSTLWHLRRHPTNDQQALLVTNLHRDLNNSTILFLALTPGHLLRPKALPMGHGRQFGEFLSMGSSFMARPFCKGRNE